MAKPYGEGTILAKSVDKNLKKLPLGAIKPQGWLLDEMLLASNLQKRIGSLSGLVKDGEWNGGESLPRYVRGLILLACALDDKTLKEKVTSYMTPIFSSANEGGDFGPKNTLSLTPKIEAVKTLLTYYEATGNERVLPFLKKFFKSQFNTYSISSCWYDSRARLLEEICAIETVYRETDLEWLQDLGEKLRDSSNDWFKLASHFSYKKPYQHYISQTALKRIQKHVLTYESAQSDEKKRKTLTPEDIDKQWYKKKHRVAVETSGVNLAKAVKYPATYGRFIGDDNLKNLSLKFVLALEKYHGTPLGMFACSPRIAGEKNVGAVDVEAGVEMLESLVEVVKETRDYSLVDAIERIVFNLVAGASFEDCSAVQDTVYVNQTEASQSRKLPYADADNAFYTKKASRGAIALLSAYPLYMQTACMVKDEELNFLTYTPCTMDISVGGYNLTVSERTGYPFRNAVLAFARGHMDAYALRDFLIAQQMNYPKPMYYSLMNLLGTHDVDRLRTALCVDFNIRDLSRSEQLKLQFSPAALLRAVELERLCALIQFSVPGVPSVYYGDEQGMCGVCDPFNRQPFKAGERELHDYYAYLARERRAADAMSTGEAVFMASSADVLMILRYITGGRDAFGADAANGAYLAVINRGDTVYSFAADCSAAGCGVYTGTVAAHSGQLFTVK